MGSNLQWKNRVKFTPAEEGSHPRVRPGWALRRFAQNSSQGPYRVQCPAPRESLHLAFQQTAVSQGRKESVEDPSRASNDPD